MHSTKPKTTIFARAFGATTLLLAVGFSSACGGEPDASAAARHVDAVASSVAKIREAMRISLIDHVGDDAGDHALIRELQAEVRERLDAGTVPGPSIERLAWSFVDKARRSHDDGYYRLAAACGAGLSMGIRARVPPGF